MKVVVGLRPQPNKTNMRSEALGTALEGAGHSVRYALRGDLVKGVDLYIQTGFAASRALESAIEAQIPYIIMEASPFRDLDINEYSSWGYNGLQGGAWRPSVPQEERPKPDLQPEHGGGQVIIGQKPTDHSLRGSDHVEWICAKRLALPEADFRPHPLMVMEGTQEPIAVALQRYGEVFTYSSTVGVDAVVAGCKAYADSEQSLLRYYRGDREEFLHELSWFQALHSEYSSLVPYIVSGYEEAHARMAQGQIEHPREKVDGAAVCEQYYRTRLCRATT